MDLPPIQESAIDNFYMKIEFAQLGGEAGGSQGGNSISIGERVRK